MDNAFADEVEQTVTINEYLEGLEAAELEADMVLGGDEGKECTYSNGYMKRQAVFSCLTCAPAGNAGVCTACSLACHDGHEVVELWTKRNFRCDCGNSKFGEFKCKLLANKELENLENGYNQNFKGSYCTCHRPYPDPETEEQVEMIQCCICEDWFHENHIGLGSSEEIPRDDEGEPLYAEFICQDCAVKVSFLKSYPPSIWAPVCQNLTVVDVQETIASVNGPIDGKSCGIIEKGSHVSKSSLDCTADANTIHVHASGKDLQSDTSMGKSNSNLGTGVFQKMTSSQNCIIGMDLNATAVNFDKKGPMLLSRKWRGHLCRCESCCKFYAKSGIHFLIDEEDSMEEYETKAKQKREENLQKQEGAEMKFIDTLDHVQKIEIMNGIADMKNELSSFLESFDSSKPITTADVHGIFENLAKKRRKM